MKIICISGKAQNGKDTTAQFLATILEEEQNKKALIVHYADLLKFYCYQYFKWNGVKDEVGRSILQTIGTTVRQSYPNYWVDHIINFIRIFGEMYDVIIIADCRFPNEIINLKQIFGNNNVITVRVIRPNFDNGLTEKQKNHISETALDNFNFDVIINNIDLNDTKDFCRTITLMI